MAPEQLVLVGSLNREAPYFEGARGIGLSAYAFDPHSLATRKLAETDWIDNPTFFSVNTDGSRIYANSEVFTWREGLVTALAFDRSAARFDYLNTQPALGSITAHNAIAPDGRHLFVVNYAMGEGGPDKSLAVFGIRDDGGLEPSHWSVAHHGTGPLAARQERSHAHSVTPTVDGRFAIVADLGIDRLIVYRIGSGCTLEKAGEAVLPPGSGPRHLALHPQGRLVFVINELASTIVSLALDPETGRMSLISSIAAVPDGAGAENHCADLQISPDGRFLYGSNRGHDSVIVVEVNQRTGTLAPRAHVPCGGATPRNLALSPSGSHLFSANQNADRVSIFARDAETGMIEDTGAAIQIGTPMCVRIVG